MSAFELSTFGCQHLRWQHLRNLTYSYTDSVKSTKWSKIVLNHWNKFTWRSSWRTRRTFSSISIWFRTWIWRIERFTKVGCVIIIILFRYYFLPQSRWRTTMVTWSIITWMIRWSKSRAIIRCVMWFQSRRWPSSPIRPILWSGTFRSIVFLETPFGTMNRTKCHFKNISRILVRAGEP